MMKSDIIYRLYCQQLVVIELFMNEKQERGIDVNHWNRTITLLSVTSSNAALLEFFSNRCTSFSSLFKSFSTTKKEGNFSAT